MDVSLRICRRFRLLGGVVRNRRTLNEKINR